MKNSRVHFLRIGKSVVLPLQVCSSSSKYNGSGIGGLTKKQESRLLLLLKNKLIKNAVCAERENDRLGFSNDVNETPILYEDDQLKFLYVFRKTYPPTYLLTQTDQTKFSSTNASSSNNSIDHSFDQTLSTTHWTLQVDLI
mmetsp:Transcript_16642/g.24841  ORF Transcript_16642/g.24841 Transcript_16642/m.24841 type:complete len:141 (+) Transcript_16642:31-453(+)